MINGHEGYVVTATDRVYKSILDLVRVQQGKSSPAYGAWVSPKELMEAHEAETMRPLTPSLRKLQEQGFIRRTNDGLITLTAKEHPIFRKPVAKPKRGYLKLSQQEREAVINGAVKHFEEEPVLGVEVAIRRALEILPEDRRPTIAKAMRWRWLLPAVQEQIAQLRKEGEGVGEGEGEGTPNPVPDLSAVSTEDLIREVAERHVREISAAFEEALHSGLTEEIKALTDERVQPFRKYKTPSTKKLRVVVLGLLKSQASMIEKEFGREFDLRFFKSSASGSRAIADMCRNADVVLGMINFLSHSNEDIVKNNAQRYLKIPGGLSALRDKLTELYVQG